MNILLGLLLVAFLLAIPVGIYLEVRMADKDYQKKLKADLEWLSDELDKPKYFIEFVAVDCRTYTTDIFVPYNVNEGSDYNMRITSEQAANRFLEICFERGYFKNNKGLTFPACQIMTAMVKK